METEKIVGLAEEAIDTAWLICNKLEWPAFYDPVKNLLTVGVPEDEVKMFNFIFGEYE